MSARPRLREDLTIVEQQFRGEQTYIVKDPDGGKYFRFKPLEMVVMQQFTGELTPEEISAGLAEQGLPFKPAAIEAFARKLRNMELLERSAAEKSVLQLERLRAQRRQRIKRKNYEGSLMRMRWSAGNPNKLFDATLPYLRFFFTRGFVIFSGLLFLTYITIIVANWSEFGKGVTSLYTPSTYTVGTVALFWVTLLVLVAIHELAHGYTCKYFGGQVHEMGAMLIYFQPAFYCNVNDAWTFPRLSHRLWVTAAGGWIELVMAGIAAILWVVAQPDTLIWQVAFFVMLISGGTAMLANANPLIPFDGYYALSDYLEIPNLRQRSFAYLSWLIKDRVLRLDVAEPEGDEREKKVFLIYSVLAFLYIATILTVVAALVLGWVSRALGALGVLAFLFLLWGMLKQPLAEWARAARLALLKHGRFWKRPILTGAIVLALALLLVPVDLTVRGLATVTPVHSVSLAAPDDAVIDRVFVSEGDRVAAGAPVVRLRSFPLERTAIRLGAAADSVAALLSRARAAGDGPAIAALGATADEYAARLESVRARIAALTLRSPVAATVVTARLHEHLGRYYEAGDEVARVDRRDTVEVAITTTEPGGMRLRPGSPAEIYNEVSDRVTELPIASVSAPDESGRMRLLVRSPATIGLRPGVTARTKLTVKRSNLLGGLWWAIRKRVSNELFL